MGVISTSARSIITTLLTFAVSMVAVAAAASMSAPASSSSERGEVNADSGSTPDTVDTGSRGGPIERMHEEASCTLTDTASLGGNWTHGDYVGSVARNGEVDAIRAAARSDCGKPVVSTQHGPPQHALDHAEQGRAHAGASASGQGHTNEAAAAGLAHASAARPPR